MKVIISLNSKYLAISKKSNLNFLFEIAGKPIVDYLINNSEKLNPEETFFLIEKDNEKLKRYIEEKYGYINLKFVQVSKRSSNFEGILKGLTEIKEKYNDDEIVIIQSFGLVNDKFNKVYEKKNTNKDIIILVDKLKKQNLKKDLKQNLKDDLKDNLTGNYWFRSLYYLFHLMQDYKSENFKKSKRFVDVIKFILDDDFKKSNYELKRVNKFFNLSKIDDYFKANLFYLKKKTRLVRDSQNSIKIVRGNLLKSVNYVNKKSKVLNSILKNCSVSEFVNIENCIIENCMVCENVKLKNVILKDTIIYENQKKIEDN